MNENIKHLLLVLVVIGLGLYFYPRMHASSSDANGPQPLPGVSEAYEKKASTVPPGMPEEAWKFYEDAKDAVYEMDRTRAEKDLSGAVRIQPDFTEAWYNLGATQANMAIDIIRNDGSESVAVQKFRDAVESKKKARDLMLQDKWYEYTGEERTQARYDVEQALEYADETLANEPMLIKMMRAWAGKEE